jgi:hypothetical protein
MKAWKLVSFVRAIEGAVIAFAATYSGGVPNATTRVIILSFAVEKRCRRQALDGYERRHKQSGYGD